MSKLTSECYPIYKYKQSARLSVRHCFVFLSVCVLMYFTLCSQFLKRLVCINKLKVCNGLVPSEWSKSLCIFTSIFVSFSLLKIMSASSSKSGTYSYNAVSSVFAEKIYIFHFYLPLCRCVYVYMLQVWIFLWFDKIWNMHILL